MISKKVTTADLWMHEPLCARYLAVFLQSSLAQVVEDESSRSTSLIWALGIVANGEREVLGAWRETVSRDATLSRIAVELGAQWRRAHWLCRRNSVE